MIEHDEADARIDISLVIMKSLLKSLTRQLQHLGRDIGENYRRTRKRIRDKCGQHASSGSEIEHLEFAILMKREQSHRGSVEIVEAGNHAPAAAIIDLRVAVEGFFHRVMGIRHRAIIAACARYFHRDENLCHAGRHMDNSRGIVTGEQAPDFSLSDSGGTVRSLSELTKDSLCVVLFYRGHW